MLRALASVLLLAALLSPTASASDLRTSDGDRIAVDDQTVMVFWSMHSEDSMEVLRTVQDLQRCGAAIVAINTDALQQRSRVSTWLRSRQLDLAVAFDADGQLQRAHTAPPVDISDPDLYASAVAMSCNLQAR